MQTFVLGPQEQDGKVSQPIGMLCSYFQAPGTSFYVHNDIFRYQDDIFADEVASTEQASGDAPIQIDSNYQEEIINENEIEPEYQEPPAPLAPEPEPVVEPEPVEAEEPKQGNLPVFDRLLSDLTFFIVIERFFISIKARN